MQAENFPDVVDTDPPDEVIASSGQVHGVHTSFTGDVGAIITEHTALLHRPSSVLDHRLVAVKNQIGDWFGDAIDAHNDGADTTYRNAVIASNAHRDADIDGGASVRGSYPV